MSAGWEVTDNMRHAARIGLMSQVGIHGLDINDPKVKAFIDQQIETQAAMAGESIWLRKIIDEQRTRINE